jgi:hypothetical protein
MNFVVHHRDVQLDTLARYAGTGAVLLGFVMCVEGRLERGENVCGVELSEEQRGCARKLRKLLMERGGDEEDEDDYGGDDEGEGEDDEDDEDGGEDEDDEDDEDEDDEDEGDGEDEDGDEDKDEDKDEDEGEDEDEDRDKDGDRLDLIQEAIGELLAALFCQRPEQQDRWFSPISRIVPFLSRRLDGTYQPPGLVTQTIAALTFIGRLTMFRLVHMHVIKNERKITYTSYVVGSS